MGKVNHTEALGTLILSLEDRKKEQFNALKHQLKLTGESLKPVNLLKSAAEEVTGNKQLKSYLIQAGIGIAVSLITKKVMSSAKENSTARLAGNLAELGLKRLSSTQIALIKMVAPLVIGFVVNSIQNRKKRKAEAEEA